MKAILPNYSTNLSDKEIHFLSYLANYTFTHKSELRRNLATNVFAKKTEVETKGRKQLEVERLEDKEIESKVEDSRLEAGVNSSTSATLSSYVCHPRGFKVVSDSKNNDLTLDKNRGVSSATELTKINYFMAEWDGFVPISKNKLVKFYGRWDYQKVRQSLVDKGIIDWNQSYSNFEDNEYTMSYKLNYLPMPIVIDYTDIRFKNKIRNEIPKLNNPFLKKLESLLHQIEYDYTGAYQYIQSQSYKSEQSRYARYIATEIMRHKPEDRYILTEGKLSHRIFSPATNMPKELRQFIFYRGNGFYDVDVSCCIPTLFNYYLDDHKNEEDIKLYRYLTTDGSDIGFYEYLQELFQETRDKTKELVMIIFFGRSNYGYADFIKLFNSSFPTVTKVIKKMKSNNYKTISHTLFALERKIMIDTATKNFLKKHRNAMLLNIHDGVLVQEPYVEKLRQEIKQSIKDEIGIDAKVKIEQL